MDLTKDRRGVPIGGDLPPRRLRHLPRGDIFVNAVRGVNLEIMVGDFVSVEGPSGTLDDIKAPSTLTPLADRRIGTPHAE